jgi:hypothetical protein
MDGKFGCMGNYSYIRGFNIFRNKCVICDELVQLFKENSVSPVAVVGLI